MDEPLVVITDPVNEEIDCEEGPFNAMWAKIGEQVRECLLASPNTDVTWCNIGVTYEADTIGHAELHRTISLR